MSRWDWPVASLLAAGLATALAACASVPMPAPTPMPTRATADETPAATPVATRSPTASASEERSLVDLGLELTVGRLRGPAAEGIGEFASDGAAVIFASGAADDVSGDHATPDLWRIVPGPTARPEMVWRNPERGHAIAKLGGDVGTYAFVDMPLTGERAWTLWLLPRGETKAVRLDEHPGDEEVPSLVPSFSVWENRVVWTAFDQGADGPVSQLLAAEGPNWKPRVLLERPASGAELWLPSLYGDRLAFTEVVYAPDRSTDERHVYLMSVHDPDGRRRLDASGRATMPVLLPDAVLWKEADPGFNMFNWGKMFRYDLATATVRRVPIRPQEYVNYPSAGGRFATWRGADSFTFGVYDHLLDETRLIERTGSATETSIVRPHLAGDLVAWMRVRGSGPGDVPELRWAFLPDAADLRR